MAEGVVVSDDELTRQANGYLLQWLNTHSYSLGLYVNDHSPALGDTLADYTECTTPGYARQTIPSGGWTQEIPVLHVVVLIQTNPRRFVPAGSATPVVIYGYFVVDNLGGLAWAEAFTTPQNFEAGFFIDVKAKFRFANCPQI